MNRARLIMIAGVSLACGDSFAVEHSTQWREQRNVVPTIYGDLRRPVLDVPQAVSRGDGHGTVSIHGRFIRVASKSPNNTEASDRYQVRIRQGYSLWRGLGTEVSAAALYDGANRRSASLGDVETALTIPLWTNRHSGGLLGVGTVWQFQDYDGYESGGSAASDPGYRFSLRMGTGTWDLGSISSVLTATYWPEALTDVPQQNDAASGSPIPAGDWRHDVVEGKAQVVVSHRFTTYLRTGLIGEARWRQWKGRGSDSTLRDWDSEAGLFIEGSLRSFHLSGSYGQDFVNRNEAGEAHRVQLGFVYGW